MSQKDKKPVGLVKPDAVALVNATNIPKEAKKAIAATIRKMPTQTVAVKKAMKVIDGVNKAILADTTAKAVSETVATNAKNLKSAIKTLSKETIRPEPGPGVPRKITIIKKPEPRPVRKNVAPPKPPAKSHRDDVTADKPHRAAAAVGIAGKVQLAAKIPTLAEMAKMVNSSRTEAAKPELKDHQKLSLSTVAEGLRQLGSKSYSPPAYQFKTR